jgi:hypothetical protein
MFQQMKGKAAAALAAAQQQVAAHTGGSGAAAPAAGGQPSSGPTMTHSLTATLKNLGTQVGFIVIGGMDET